ncbi:MAG: hypothetical protein SF066_03845 [Thermoanaerobaculia bacterium]|nr:hypothetical protein [Thermoanaerobaculia bacterium]
MHALALFVTLSAVLATGGWMKKTETDRLTGREVTFVRGYVGAGQGSRLFDVMRVDDAFFFRFVVTQPSSPTFQGRRLETPKEVGRVRYSIDGKEPHEPAAERTYRDIAEVGAADFGARWAVGCEDLRELATGKFLRVVTDAFDAEFPLAGLLKPMEKAFGFSQKDLIQRTASVCQ